MGEEEEDGVVVVAMDAAMGGTIALDMVIVELFDCIFKGCSTGLRHFCLKKDQE